MKNNTFDSSSAQKERISPAVKRAQQATLKKVRINDLVSVKGGRGLIPWFLKILVLLQVDLSRSWSRVFGSYARRCNKLIQKIGRGNKRVSVVYLSLYLKTCSTLLQQSVGGQKLQSTQRLGCAVARTGKGLPRIIPALHRRKIRQNRVIYIRVWLSLFGLYRILEWVGKLKTSTITAPFTGFADWDQYADHLEPFFHKLAHLIGGRFLKGYTAKKSEVENLLRDDPEGESNPFQETGYWNQYLHPVTYRQIIKSSPLNLPAAGFTSSSFFSQIFAAKTWVKSESSALMEALVGVLRVTNASQPPRKVVTETTELQKVWVTRPKTQGVIDYRLNPGYSRILELEKFMQDYPDINAESNKLLLARLKAEASASGSVGIKLPDTPQKEYRFMGVLHTEESLLDELMRQAELVGLPTSDEGRRLLAEALIAQVLACKIVPQAESGKTGTFRKVRSVVTPSGSTVPPVPPSVEYERVQVERLVTVTKVSLEESKPQFDVVAYIKKLAEAHLLIPEKVPQSVLNTYNGIPDPLVSPEDLARPGFLPLKKKNFNLGKLGTKIEPAGKVRVFALVDLFTQLTLYPLHILVQDILRGIPQDGTFDQVSPGIALGKWARESGQKWVASYDLSAATDRLPISLQQVLLQFIVGAAYSENWGTLLTQRDYWLQGKPLRYEVGQPMGALSSWVMLALTHHFVVQLAHARAGGVGWFKRYYVLGDDMVIADQKVASLYLVIMDELGLTVNQNKSLISSRGVMEFAKKLYRYDVEMTPVSLKELLTTSHSAPVLLETARKYGLSLADILKLAGYRHMVLGRVSGSFKRLPKRAHTLLVCALSPTGPHSVPFKDWIMLTSITGSKNSNLHPDRVEVLKIQLWRDLLAIAKRANQLRLQEFDPLDPLSKRDPAQGYENIKPFIEVSEFLWNVPYDTALFMWNEVIEDVVLQRRTRLVRLAKRVEELLRSEMSRRFFEIDLDELAVLYELFTELRSELMFLIKTPVIQHQPNQKDEPFLAKFKVWSKYGALRPRSGRTSERERTLFLSQRRLARKYGADYFENSSSSR